MRTARLAHLAAQACRHVIKPATEKQRTSFIELVAFAPQLTDWFVSHWWGEPVFDFVACIEQHFRDHVDHT